MRVCKWGNSLAVRLPAALIEALDLKDGDAVELHVMGDRSFQVVRETTRRELLSRLRKYRGRLPANFRFDRLASV